MTDYSLRLAALSDAKRALLERRLLDGRPAPAGEPVRAEAASGPPPLSFGQERLWFLEQLDPGTRRYSMGRAVRLSGRLDLPALETTIAAIAARHDVLRTHFGTIDGEPVQIVAPPAAVSVPVHDVSALPPDQAAAEAVRLSGAVLKCEFDLATGPLFRAALIRLGPEEHWMVLAFHHSVFDGWSFPVLLREIAAIYPALLRGEPMPLPPMPIQYGDYARWQRSRLRGTRLHDLVAYWTKQLGGLDEMALPTDRRKPATPDFRGAVETETLSIELTATLHALARSQGATLFMVVAAGLQLLLGRLAGSDDVAIGTPMASRPKPELEALIGFFVNTLVLRTDLSGNPRFRELIGRVRDVALAAYAHQELPFEKAIEQLQTTRGASRDALTEVVLNFVNTPSLEFDLPGLRLSPVAGADSEAKSALTIYAVERNGRLVLQGVYQCARFNPARVRSMLDQLVHLLAQGSNAPDRPIADLSLVTPAARDVLPDPAAPLAIGDEIPVPQAFALAAAEHGERLAVVEPGRAWSYAQLLRAVAAVVRRLTASGVCSGDVVAVVGERRCELVAAALGVMSAGAVLLLVDPSLPAERRGAMFREARVRRIIVAGEGSNSSGADGLSDDLILISRAELEISAAPCAPLSISPDDPAYVVFTSGTTGVPKGVVGTHRGLSHFLRWQRETFRITPADRVAQLTALSFDVVYRDLFLPLTSGASLHLPGTDNDATSGHLLDWLDRTGITVIHTVPTLAQLWLTTEADRPRLAALRWLFFAGEPLSGSLVARWRDAFPESGAIVNLYGPTETTLATCAYVVPDECGSETQPVGRPIDGAQALVLRAAARCGIGEPGEIVVRTPYRTRGYLNARPMDRPAFVTNPFTAGGDDLLYRTGDRGRFRPDGILEIDGRLDDGVKVRGVRIDLGEVASVLAGHPGVAAAAAAVHDGPDGAAAVVGYVVAAAGPLTPGELRARVERVLPGAAVPSQIVFLDRLPVTRHGKLDRHALVKPIAAAAPVATSEGPQSATERIVADIWSELLAAGPFGRDDNFFDRGGHSLLAARLLARLRTTCGVELPLRSVFESASIRGLAALIDSQRTATGPADAVIRRVDRQLYREAGPERRPLAPPEDVER
ncbi:MAG: amino acid adenylation domain-containing protein [Vicinamibacterales bacterium]